MNQIEVAIQQIDFLKNEMSYTDLTIKVDIRKEVSVVRSFNIKELTELGLSEITLKKLKDYQEKFGLTGEFKIGYSIQFLKDGSPRRTWWCSMNKTLLDVSNIDKLRDTFESALLELGKL